MTTKTKIILISVSAIIAAILLFGGGFWAAKSWYGNQKPIVTIKPVGPGTTTVIQTPNTPDEWLAWKKAPIKITGKLTSDNIFMVSASDGFKSGQRDFKIKVTCPDERKNILSFNYVGIYGFGHSDKSFSHGGMIIYTRILLPMVGINFGILATQRELGVTGGLSIKF